MALPNDVIDHEAKLLKRLGISYKGLKWCELGDQICYGPPIIPAKKMYESKGVAHTSLDINGRNGAQKIDLNKEIPESFKDSFDVVTNYGTAEHVDNQFEVFKSIHVMCKQGGIIIHGLPVVGNWPKHCTFCYSEEFIKKLITLCNYEILEYRFLHTGAYSFPKNVISCFLRKTNNNEFISKKDFESIPGLVKNNYVNRTGHTARK